MILNELTDGSAITVLPDKRILFLDGGTIYSAEYDGNNVQTKITGLTGTDKALSGMTYNQVSG